MTQLYAEEIHMLEGLKHDKLEKYLDENPRIVPPFEIDVVETAETYTTPTTAMGQDEEPSEELLAVRIRQLKRRPEDLENVRKIMEAARMKNKIQFDKTHQLRPKKIEEGDWVLVTTTLTNNTRRQASSQEGGSGRMW